MGLFVNIILLIFLLVSNAQAHWGMKLSAGAELRTSQSRFNSDVAPTQFNNLFAGVRYQKMVFGLEYAQSKTEGLSSGIFTVQKRQEKYLAWFHYLTDQLHFFQPYLGLGLGSYRDQNNLSLGTQSTGSQGLWNDMWAVSFGGNILAVKSWPIWAGPEFRIQQLSSEASRTEVSGLLTLGFLF